MIELTKEQHAALGQESPPRVRDLETDTTYVLLRQDVYERLKGLLYDSEFPISEAYPLMDEVAAKAGWNDPAMDIYDDLALKERP